MSRISRTEAPRKRTRAIFASKWLPTPAESGE
jgi:hypothetical protein